MTGHGTGALREEHRHLIAHIEHLREAAEEMPRLSDEERAELLGRVLGFLRADLLPHAQSEDLALYPAIADIYGHPGATDTMGLDHRAIAERIAALADADRSDTARLQELLYGLHALITVHFRKEEEVYLPLLEQRPEAEVEDLLARVTGDVHGRS